MKWLGGMPWTKSTSWNAADSSCTWGSIDRSSMSDGTAVWSWDYQNYDRRFLFKSKSMFNQQFFDS